MKLGKWGPKPHLQLPIIVKDAVKDDKIKIFEIITLNLPDKTLYYIKSYKNLMLYM